MIMEIIAVNTVKTREIKIKILRILNGGMPAHCIAISSFVLESFVNVMDRDIRNDMGRIINVASGRDKKIIEKRYLIGILKPIISYIFRNFMTINIDKSPKNIPLKREKNSFKMKAFSFFTIH